MDVELNALMITTAKGAVYALHKFTKISRIQNESDLVGRIAKLSKIGLELQLTPDLLILLTKTDTTMQPRFIKENYQKKSLHGIFLA